MKRMLSIALTLLLCVSLCAVGTAEATAASAQTPAIDLDLSQMSGTVVYAQVFQMMMDPDAYVGKVIRLSGLYDVFEDDETGMVYTSCIIPDATACCAQGIEFVWGGDHPYPDDYPEPGADVTVTGKFETYMEGEYLYIHLVDAEVIWAS